MKQGWIISTIGSVAKVFNGNSINAEEKKAKYEGLEEGYPFIATKDVGVNGEVDYDNGVKIPFDTDFKIAMPDAVFVCAEGGSAGKKVAHIDRKVCFGNKLFALQPIKEKVKGGFLYYAVQEAGFKAQFRLLMAGIIGGVSAKKFNLITIPIPPLSEQQRIVALLDAEFAKIDALKANAEKNLQNAKDLFQAALKKELEPKEGWKKLTLKDIAIVKIGPFGSSLHKKDYISGGTPIVNPVHMKDCAIVASEDFSVNQDKLKQLSNYLLQTGDIVFARRGEIGRCALVTEKENGYLCGTGSLFVRFIKNQNSQFVIKLFSSSYICNQLLAKASGATMLNINSTIVEDLHFYLPSNEEQDSILSHLDTLNEKCKTLQTNYEKTLSLCDDLKQALLRKAFNGEI